MKITVLLIVVAVIAVPTVAYAAHVFDDVDDGRFYAQPVEWAADNNITTGKTADIFDPDGAVTRGESVTFLKRYDDNIVQPAIVANQQAAAAAQSSAGTAQSTAAAAQSTADANAAALSALPVVNFVSVRDVDDWNGSEQVLDGVIDAPADGVVLLTMSANVDIDAQETATGYGDLSGGIYVDDAPYGPTVWARMDFSVNGSTQQAAETLHSQQIISVSAGDTIRPSARMSLASGPGGLAYIYDFTMSMQFIAS